jgi:hypothetical protein
MKISSPKGLQKVAGGQRSVTTGSVTHKPTRPGGPQDL